MSSVGWFTEYQRQRNEGCKGYTDTLFYNAFIPRLW